MNFCLFIISFLLALRFSFLDNIPVPSKARFYIFLFYTLFTLCIALIYSIFAHIIFSWVGRSDLAPFTTGRLWWYLTAPITGLKLVIDGEELLHGWGGYGTGHRNGKKGPCVFVVNHQSNLDILLMGRLWQPHTTVCATWRVKSMPLLGRFLERSKSIFVDPPPSESSGITNRGIIIEAAKLMREANLNLWIFPEGIRSFTPTTKLLPLKKGCIVIALEAGNVPIVPIVISNTAGCFDMHKKRYAASRIKVKVLSSVMTDVKEGESRDAAIERILGDLKQVMEEGLMAISPS